MSNINNLLPIGNSTNWGQQINTILQNINQRVGKLESAFSNETGVEIHNLGYAGSGIVGPCELSLTKNSGEEDYTFRFCGKVFIGSTVNTYISTNVEVKNEEFTIGPSEYYKYVYLFYNNDINSTSVAEKLEIQTDKDFYYDYTHIMLGIVYWNGTNINFIPKVYSSAKTSMQHNDENYRRWLYGESLSRTLSFSIGADSISKIVCTITGSDEYTLYADGYGDNSNLSNYESTDKMTIETNTKVLYIVNNLRSEGSNFLNVNAWTFARVLIANDGTTILQKCLSAPDTTYSPTSLNLVGLSDIMLDLEFNNNINYLWASDFVEIGRIAFYLQNISGSANLVGITSTDANYFYVKSHSNGITPQASVNLQSINSGTIYLNHTEWTNDSSSNNQVCALQLQGTSSGSYIYTKKEYIASECGQIKATGNQDSSTLTWTLDASPSTELGFYFNQDTVLIDGIKYPKVKINSMTLYTKLRNGGSWEVLSPKTFSPAFEIIKDGASRSFSYIDPNTGEEGIFYIVWSNSTFNIYIEGEYIFKLAEWELASLTSYDTTSDKKYYLNLNHCNTNSELLTNNFRGAYISLNYDEYKGLSINGNSSYLEYDNTNGTSLRQLVLTGSGAYLNYYESNNPIRYLHLTSSNVKLQYNNNNSITIDNSSIDIANGDNYITLQNVTTIEASNSINLTAFTIDLNGTIDSDIIMNEGKSLIYLSDQRCKHNIFKTTTQYLPIVTNVPIVEYQYKNFNAPQIGIIAQDLEAVLDSKSQSYFIDIVQDKDIKDKRVLKETKLVYILWKAIQEQQKEIEELKQKIK